jgi:carbamoyl-phosphate synthase large subunit
MYALLSPSREVHCADADPGAMPCGLPAERWHAVPSASSRYFVTDLWALCERLAIDLLIPGVDEELRSLAMARQRGAFPCAMLLPSYAFVGTHLDKLASMKALSAAGIPIPQTWRRAILKPREGRGSKGLQQVGHSDGLIVQEQLEGQEYTVTMVADLKARLRAVVPVRVDCKRGVTIRGATEQNALVMVACQRIHDVQGILTDDGFKPFEINPRISTTTCLAIAAGVDVIGLSQDVSESVSATLAPFQIMSLRRSWRTEFAAA